MSPKITSGYWKGKAWKPGKRIHLLILQELLARLAWWPIGDEEECAYGGYRDDDETTLEWSCVKPWISEFLIKDSRMRWIGPLGEFPPPSKRNFCPSSCR